MMAVMGSLASETRAVASRVATILRDRSRNDEAIAILCACAAAFDNDHEGQSLLAEALRIDPNSSLARMAFERMEGVAGQHGPLDQAIAHYGHDELLKLERALRPVFQRAQVGFNNNVKYKGAEYHIQTEDSGLDKPHIITHLFADGGRVIKSVKRSYASEVARPDVSLYVRGLMKGQHMEMLLALREGRFDEIIAGRAQGGLEVLEHAPHVDLDRIGKGAKGAAGAKSQRPPVESAQPAVVVPAIPAAQLPLRARLHVLRSLSGGPDYYDLRGDQVIVGTEGAVRLEGDRFCHPREAAFVFDPAQGLHIQDLDGGNGVFLRIRSRVEIGVADEFVIGDQLCRLERNPDANDGPDPGPTYFRSSLKWPSAFRVVQLFEGGATGAVAMARGTTLQIGRMLDYANDLVFARDPLVAPYHCIIEEQAEAFVLTDLGLNSMHGQHSGVFVRVSGRYLLAHGSELLIGRTRLLVDLSPTNPALPPLA